MRQSQRLVALSLCLSLCPSLTCQLSDVAVILGRPFICLSNGNPPLVSLRTAALIPVLYFPSAFHFSVHPSSHWVTQGALSTLLMVMWIHFLLLQQEFYITTLTRTVSHILDEQYSVFHMSFIDKLAWLVVVALLATVGRCASCAGTMIAGRCVVSSAPRLLPWWLWVGVAAFWVRWHLEMGGH